MIGMERRKRRTMIAEVRSVQWAYWLRRFGTLIGFLLVVGVFWWQRPTTFMTIPNWLNITQQISILGVVAFTMTIVMVMGDFDLSVGTMASLAGIVAAVLFRAEQPVIVGVVAALVGGVLGGVFNGAMVSYIGISPFIATLGTMTMFGGLALKVSDGKTIFGRAIPAEVSDFALGGIPLGTINERAILLPNLTILALVVLVVAWIILGQTVFGRRLYAIGGDREGARVGGGRGRLVRPGGFMCTR